MKNYLKTICPIDQLEEFIKEVNDILSETNFTPKSQFIIQLNKKSVLSGDMFTTYSTLQDLQFNTEDVINVIHNLQIEDYVESMLDERDVYSKPFHVFGKTINKKEVYIKFKIKKLRKKQIFCISFHYAKYPLKKKYK